MFNFAGKLAPAGLGAIAKSSDIVWAYLIEVFLFGQKPTWTTWLGVFLVICSLVLIEVVQTPKNKKSEQIKISDKMREKSIDEEKKEDESTYLLSNQQGHDSNETMNR